MKVTIHFDCGPESDDVICGVREMRNGILLLRRLRNSGFIILRQQVDTSLAGLHPCPHFLLLGCGEFQNSSDFGLKGGSKVRQANYDNCFHPTQ